MGGRPYRLKHHAAPPGAYTLLKGEREKKNNKLDSLPSAHGQCALPRPLHGLPQLGTLKGSDFLAAGP